MKKKLMVLACWRQARCLPKRDSLSALMLEVMADRTRRFLPTHTTGHRAPGPITVGLTAIIPKIAGVISG